MMTISLNIQLPLPHMMLCRNKATYQVSVNHFIIDLQNARRLVGAIRQCVVNRENAFITKELGSNTAKMHSKCLQTWETLSLFSK